MGANGENPDRKERSMQEEPVPDEEFGDPFASFTEWAEAEDEAAWAYLSDPPEAK